MKKIILATLILFFSLSISYGQNPNQPFVGTWQWENGSQIFQVKLKLDSEGDIEGDFCMIQENGNGLAPTVIYKSDKDLPYGLKYPSAIRGNSISGIKMGGFVEDNSSDTASDWLYGRVEVVIQNNSSGAVTATWKVKRRQGIRASTDNRTFNIPTDIVLTKVSNLVIND